MRPRPPRRTLPPAAGLAGRRRCDSAPRRVPLRPSPAAPGPAGGPVRMLRRPARGGNSARAARPGAAVAAAAAPGGARVPESPFQVAARAGAERAPGSPCCQPWGCGARPTPPAMAAAEEAAARGEGAGRRPQVGARRRTRGLWVGGGGWRVGASSRRGTTPPGGRTLLAAHFGRALPPAGLGAKVVPWGTSAGRRPACTQGAGGGGWRPRPSPAFGLPAAGLRRPGLGVLAMVSWRGTVHPVTASSRTPPTTGRPPRRLQGLLPGLVRFHLPFVGSCQ